jgi:hypothetical protein
VAVGWSDGVETVFQPMIFPPVLRKSKPTPQKNGLSPEKTDMLLPFLPIHLIKKNNNSDPGQRK